MTTEKIHKLIKKGTLTLTLNGNVIEDLGSFIDLRLSHDREDWLFIEFDSGEGHTSVHLLEPCGCCGKLYLCEFSEGDVFAEELFELVEKLAKIMEYSYIGFVHIKDENWIEIAKKHDYREIARFENERSGNTLSEMCRIIKY